jgi:hypothetical protein
MFLRLELCLLGVAAICFGTVASPTMAGERSKTGPALTVAIRTADDPFGPNGNSATPAAANAPGADSGASQPGVSHSVEAIKRALKEQVSLNLGRVSLKEGLDYIGDKFKIEVQLDGNAIRDVAIDPTATPIDLTIKNVALRSALDLILSPFNLTYVIKDEVLLITSKDKAATMLETRLYDVRDIVAREGENHTEIVTFDPLMDAVRMTVNPQTWDVNGGPCSLMSFNSNGICGLIVVQTYHGQDQVENLLTQLRRLKPAPQPETPAQPKTPALQMQPSGK